MSITQTTSRRELRARLRRLQIDPSDGYAYYQILDGSTVLAEIVATKTKDPTPFSGMVAGMEYWKIGNDNIFRTSGCLGTSLVVKRVRNGAWRGAGQSPFKAADASFTTPVSVRWYGPTTASCHKSTSYDYGFAVEVQRQSGQWQGTMNFYRNFQDPVFKTIAEGASEEFEVWNSYSYSQSCVINLP